MNTEEGERLSPASPPATSGTAPQSASRRNVKLRSSLPKPKKINSAFRRAAETSGGGWAASVSGGALTWTDGHRDWPHTCLDRSRVRVFFKQTGDVVGDGEQIHVAICNEHSTLKSYGRRQRVTWAGVMCVWVTYPWTCWICDSCLSATWTSSAPRRSQWRPRVPSLPRDRSLSLSIVLTPPPSRLQVPPSRPSLPRVPPSLPRVPPSLPRVPPSLPRVPPSLPRVPPSLSSRATPIGWWWQVWWWSFGAPGDAPSSSW